MTSYTSNISSLERSIVDLQRQDATEAKKEADLTSKHYKAVEAAGRASSTSTMTSKLKDAERASHDLASVKKKRADLSSQMASKSKDLRSYLEKQAKEDQSALKKAADTQKKMADEQKRMIREREDHDRRVRSDLHRRAISFPTSATDPNTEGFDFFISHASEDKESFVRSLAQELTTLGAKIFYDEATLRVGDSLRRKIDDGLARSRFGVVVLSEHFFRKEWPQRELDGLVAREIQGVSRILPIWHKVSKDEVAANSPTLADKVALNSSTKSVSEIAKELYDMLGT
ncbi:toll/interleukin-1 receptor domain-containing protein [Methylobacterium sp. Leaf100]|uniref:toll/interleukin-1 receptor domain-containing protein n=1 Tax=Methylobacterium sp. Leaf100 TaxID=1736252 RepID=UPI0006FBF570|nr:toll/interleukin-1 receptor domain-containing protein [Methylobacterium sp. Leaf100]KQP35951.1 molecular chaperone Tir [Methylobacterium sp. Leaf100]